MTTEHENWLCPFKSPIVYPALLDTREFNRLEQHTKITAQDRIHVTKVANKKKNKQPTNVWLKRLKCGHFLKISHENTNIVHLNQFDGQPISAAGSLRLNMKKTRKCSELSVTPYLTYRLL
jgi:hypothetical protein